MLTCRELTELITDHIEGQLSLVQRLRFQVHAGMCRHCRFCLRQMKMTIRALRLLPLETVPPQLPGELLRRFRNWRG
ncbi:MAG: zf-HC2 domain-containing protein [Acidobacteria bacterium]|nr:zf-HC2 domain-containing protein [Acidobacteriota bacterium]